MGEGVSCAQESDARPGGRGGETGDGVGADAVAGRSARADGDEDVSRGGGAGGVVVLFVGRRGGRRLVGGWCAGEWRSRDEEEGEQEEPRHRPCGRSHRLTFDIKFDRSAIFKELTRPTVPLGVDTSNVRVKLMVSLTDNKPCSNMQVGCVRESIFLEEGQTKTVSELVRMEEDELLEWEQIESTTKALKLVSTSKAKPSITIKLTDGEAGNTTVTFLYQFDEVHVASFWGKKTTQFFPEETAKVLTTYMKRRWAEDLLQRGYHESSRTESAPRKAESTVLKELQVEFGLPFNRSDVFNELAKFGRPLGASEPRIAYSSPDGSIGSDDPVKVGVMRTANFSNEEDLGMTLSQCIALEPNRKIVWRQVVAEKKGVVFCGTDSMPPETAFELSNGQPDGRPGTAVKLTFSFVELKFDGVACTSKTLPDPKSFSEMSHAKFSADMEARGYTNLVSPRGATFNRSRGEEEELAIKLLASGEKLCAGDQQKTLGTGGQDWGNPPKTSGRQGFQVEFGLPFQRTDVFTELTKFGKPLGASEPRITYSCPDAIVNPNDPVRLGILRTVQYTSEEDFGMTQSQCVAFEPNRKIVWRQVAAEKKGVMFQGADGAYPETEFELSNGQPNGQPGTTVKVKTSFDLLSVNHVLKPELIPKLKKSFLSMAPAKFRADMEARGYTNIVSPVSNVNRSLGSEEEEAIKARALLSQNSSRGDQARGGNGGVCEGNCRQASEPPSQPTGFGSQGFGSQVPSQQQVPPGFGTRPIPPTSPAAALPPGFSTQPMYTPSQKVPPGFQTPPTAPSQNNTPGPQYSAPTQYQPPSQRSAQYQPPSQYRPPSQMQTPNVPQPTSYTPPLENFPTDSGAPPRNSYQDRASDGLRSRNSDRISETEPISAGGRRKVMTGGLYAPDSSHCTGNNSSSSAKSNASSGAKNRRSSLKVMSAHLYG
ncbi:hypothetical protein AB1Y20_013550 [Prymnesium parvum]|uniref:Uncharacterized protein n=1 Tax=Prymnesium parvum TaxID=97485 RepID=A0AB34II26_PRYPA